MYVNRFCSKEKLKKKLEKLIKCDCSWTELQKIIRHKNSDDELFEIILYALDTISLDQFELDFLFERMIRSGKCSTENLHHIIKKTKSFYTIYLTMKSSKCNEEVLIDCITCIFKNFYFIKLDFDGLFEMISTLKNITPKALDLLIDYIPTKLDYFLSLSMFEAVVVAPQANEEIFIKSIEIGNHLCEGHLMDCTVIYMHIIKSNKLTPAVLHEILKHNVGSEVFKMIVDSPVANSDVLIKCLDKTYWDELIEYVFKSNKLTESDINQIVKIEHLRNADELIKKYILNNQEIHLDVEKVDVPFNNSLNDDLIKTGNPIERTRK